MRLMKLEHSTLVLEEGGERLIIDPGSFTTPITEATGVVAIVITHEHGDHWTADQVRRILADSPQARILGPSGVAAAAASDFPVETVSPGDVHSIGAFTLRFFGGRHAVIHSSIPVVDNVGVLVNDTLYYAGDSFHIPEGVSVDALAVPAGAPWMKVGDAIDYVLAVAPKRAFPVHEMVLSRAGKDLSNTRLQWAVEQGGGHYDALEPGDSIQL
ncbi:MBL fold metallo-hydrolase [Rathayibacter sp. YIM 133350]|uniref:MBL fold metallo-hydrolase n=1 Tax=Rathayibacter sp. YIM 133350 TaxID=3131992 RepID=UPI00307E5BB6